MKGAQWLSGRVLDLRLKGRGFEPHRRHCVVSLSKNINPSLVLVQPRKTRPFITERLLMGRKVSNQIKRNKMPLFRWCGSRCEKALPVYEVCEQQRPRPACASTQSNQGLCRLLVGKYHIHTCYSWNFTFLSSLCSWAGWFGYELSETLKTGFLITRPNNAHITTYVYRPHQVKTWIHLFVGWSEWVSLCITSY